jgi:putative addiction module killer protein
VRLIEYYQTPSGAEPYKEWLLTLNWKVAARIDAYVDRVAKGGSKLSLKSVRGEIFEIRVDLGPGYRVYFGRNQLLMVLLLGGDKRSQQRDIEQALRYWRGYCATNK